MTHILGSSQRVRAVLAASAALVLTASTALADIMGPGIQIVAQSGDSIAVWESGELTWNPDAGEGGAWVFESTETITLADQSGNVLGILNPNGEGISIIIQEDPVVNLGFAVQAGAADTEFKIGSAQLMFPTIGSAFAQGRASVGMSVTDLNGNGVTLTGMGFASNSGAYTAVYNGWAVTGGGTVFADSIPTLSNPNPGGSNTASVNTPPVGFAPINDDVSSMSSLVHFTLSAGDIASGTSTWVVIPEPASFALFGLGLVLLRRR